MRAFEYWSAMRARTALFAHILRVDTSPLFIFFLLVATPTSLVSFHLGRVSMDASVAMKVSSMQFCAALLEGVIDVPRGVRDVVRGAKELRGGVVDQKGGD